MLKDPRFRAHTANYVRHGTTTLFAALNVLEGERGILRRGQLLVDRKPAAVAVDQGEIGEGSADIDAEPQPRSGPDHQSVTPQPRTRWHP